MIPRDVPEENIKAMVKAAGISELIKKENEIV